mgnify:CR=1 FL=1
MARTELTHVYVVTQARSREDGEAVAVEMRQRGRLAAVVQCTLAPAWHELLAAAVIGTVMGLVLRLL